MSLKLGAVHCESIDANRLLVEKIPTLQNSMLTWYSAAPAFRAFEESATGAAVAGGSATLDDCEVYRIGDTVYANYKFQIFAAQQLAPGVTFRVIFDNPPVYGLVGADTIKEFNRVAGAGVICRGLTDAAYQCMVQVCPDSVVGRIAFQFTALAAINLGVTNANTAFVTVSYNLQRGEQ